MKNRNEVEEFIEGQFEFSYNVKKKYTRKKETDEKDHRDCRSARMIFYEGGPRQVGYGMCELKELLNFIYNVK